MNSKASNARKPTPMSEAIAAQVRAERAAANIQKDEMIRRTGIGRGTYFALESGDRPFDVSQLSAVCGVLGMTMSELLTRAQERLDPQVTDVTRREA